MRYTRKFQANIVANGTFNPLNFDKYFYIKNNVVLESEPVAHISEAQLKFSHLQTSTFTIAATVGQIIITDVSLDVDANISDVAAKFLSAIQDSGDTLDAIGINFGMYLEDSDKDSVKLSQELFKSSEIPLFSDFLNTENAGFGVYLSTDVLDCRLKLEAKPSTSRRVIGQNEKDYVGIHFSFNYHFETSSFSRVLESLENYQDYLKHAVNLVNSFVK